MTINQKYSYKDFSDQSFKEVNSNEFNNTEIIGSCFFQKEPNTDIFPIIKGVKFTKCNLDNVLIPSGNIIGEKTSTNRIKLQNDLMWWNVNINKEPTTPFLVSAHNTLGLSTNSKNIPSKCIGKEIISKVKWDKSYGRGVLPPKSKFKEIPIIKEEIVFQGIAFYIIEGEGYFYKGLNALENL